MKRLAALSAASILALTLSSCGATSGADGGDDMTVKVASHMTPMTDVVKVAAEVAQEDGVTIELVQVNDNVQYNSMLKAGDVDANFAQHKPYMEMFNKENDAHLVQLAPIYDAKVGYYSKSFDSLAALPDGAKIAIPNDVSNEGRALAILDSYGVISLAEGVGFEGTEKDIVDNPKNIEFVKVDLLNLSSAYDEDGIAAVYNYPTYIAKVGLTPADSIALEQNIDQRFSISLVAREDNQDEEKIKITKEAFTSDKVREFLQTEHSETLVPSF